MDKDRADQPASGPAGIPPDLLAAARQRAMTVGGQGTVRA